MLREHIRIDTVTRDLVTNGPMAFDRKLSKFDGGSSRSQLIVTDSSVAIPDVANRD